MSPQLPRRTLLKALETFPTQGGWGRNGQSCPCIPTCISRADTRIRPERSPCNKPSAFAKLQRPLPPPACQSTCHRAA